MRRSWILPHIATVLSFVCSRYFPVANSFLPGLATSNFCAPRPSSRLYSASKATAALKATLTEETVWRLRFSVSGVRTSSGRTANDLLFAVEANFLEEEGYEPPQGNLVQIVDEDDADGDGVGRLRITEGRWQLSEDPNDRKDGLWVWGLFKEPLYPFLLLKLRTEVVKLPGEDGDTVAPLELYAQISHVRDKEAGVILKASTLNVREMETVKADVFGVANVDVFEEVSVGQLSIQPLL